MSQALTGTTVAVTRPQQQAQALLETLKDEGAAAISVPLLEIEKNPLKAALEQQLKNLANADILICVSVNAVQTGLAYCQQLGVSLPETVLAVGPATAASLQAQGVAKVIVSEAGSNSEALLELETLENVTGNNIHIWRGGEGRELLGDTLAARGATIEYVDLYERVSMTLTQQQVKQLVATEVDIICVTSIAALEHLFEQLENQRSALKSKTLLLGSQRIYRHAVERGHLPEQCLVATDPSNEAMLSIIRQHAQQQGLRMTDESTQPQSDALPEIETYSNEQPVAEVDADAVPLAKPAKSGGSGFGTLLSVLAFLLAAGGIGGAYYFYEKEIKPILSASVSQQEVKQLDSRLTEQSSQLENMGSKVEETTEEVTELRSTVTTERTNLLLAQVEHLVNIASDRLTYMSDAATAESALQEATERLMDFDNPAMRQVQQTINEDLERVRAYQVVDANEVLVDLNNIVDSLRPLPAVDAEQTLADDDRAPEPVANGEEEGRPSSISDVWSSFKKSIGDSVKVVETDYPVSGISSSAINRYKLDILKMRVEAMRLALARSDNLAFNAEISEAQSWVIDNLQGSLGQPILTELLRLRSLNFQVIPNVDRSINAIQNLSQEISGYKSPESPEFEPLSMPSTSGKAIDGAQLRVPPVADSCNACILPEPVKFDGALL